MTQNLHEERTHGSAVFPLEVYISHNGNEFYSVSQHWHEEYEWIYVESGRIHLTLHGKEILLSPGDCCFINSGELHAIHAYEESLYYAIVFQPGFLDFAMYDACQHNFVRPLTAGKLLFPATSHTFDPALAASILEHMCAIKILYFSLPSCALLSIKIHILQVIELLFQHNCFIENTVTSKEADTQNNLKKVIEYIHQNYSQSISLATLSGICYLSPNYFCQYFRQATGKTPVAFINEYRIQKAAALLLESELPISSIALSVGFDNFSYFIRKFKEYKGVTPQTYRMLAKNER